MTHFAFDTWGLTHKRARFVSFPPSFPPFPPTSDFRKKYALSQTTEVSTAGRKLTFQQYFEGLTAALNAKVVEIVSAMAQALAGG